MDSLTDPSGANPLIAAMLWLQGTLLGAAATSVAIIAVAATGMMMLSGRVAWRRGVSVILGCFILFGASSMAAGIRSAAGGAADWQAVPYQAGPSPTQSSPDQHPIEVPL